MKEVVHCGESGCDVVVESDVTWHIDMENAPRLVVRHEVVHTPVYVVEPRPTETAGDRLTWMHPYQENGDVLVYDSGTDQWQWQPLTGTR